MDDPLQQEVQPSNLSRLRSFSSRDQIFKDHRHEVDVALILTILPVFGFPLRHSHDEPACQLIELVVRRRRKHGAAFKREGELESTRPCQKLVVDQHCNIAGREIPPAQLLQQQADDSVSHGRARHCGPGKSLKIARAS
ncbi:hypothetical protein D9M72_417470 [compost metagenome]